MSADTEAKVLLVDIWQKGFGLSNQIFTLVHSVFEAKRASFAVISVGKFAPHFQSNAGAVPVSSVIDLPHLNEFLEGHHKMDGLPL